MGMQTQLDMIEYVEAKAARDRALDQVLKHAGSLWVEQGLDIISRMQAGRATGESLRRAMLDIGLHPPHHSNAWGALIRTAVKRGLLAPTGTWQPMATKSSHARQTPVYQIKGPKHV